MVYGSSTFGQMPYAGVPTIDGVFPRWNQIQRYGSDIWSRLSVLGGLIKINATDFLNINAADDKLQTYSENNLFDKSSVQSSLSYTNADIIGSVLYINDTDVLKINDDDFLVTFHSSGDIYPMSVRPSTLSYSSRTKPTGSYVSRINVADAVWEDSSVIGSILRINTIDNLKINDDDFLATFSLSGDIYPTSVHPDEIEYSMINGEQTYLLSSVGSFLLADASDKIVLTSSERNTAIVRWSDVVEAVSPTYTEIIKPEE